MEPEFLIGKTIERVERIDWDDNSKRWEFVDRQYASSLLLHFADGTCARLDSTYSHAGVSVEEHVVPDTGIG